MQETTFLNNEYGRLSRVCSITENIWKDPYGVLFVRLSSTINIIHSVLKLFSIWLKHKY